jgi:CheY-like chemotaxis protein
MTGKRLLVVDDNRLVLEVVADFFAPHGWEVARAEDGAAALVLLESFRPDAIVADILMPNLDGWGLYDAVRARPDLAEVPYVFLTVDADLPQRLRALHQGADDFIPKPFEVEELHARVERLIERRARRAEAGNGETALLSGSVEHLAMSDLLQILALNGKDGTVALEQNGSRGSVEFVGGVIVHAACDGTRGLKALYRMLGWPSAGFRVLAREGNPRERSIDGPASNVIMDGLVSLDEWGRWSAVLPPRGARLAFTTDAKLRLEGHPVSPAEFEVLTRARNGATVAAILDDAPQPDAVVAEAVAGLISRGVLRMLD